MDLEEALAWLAGQRSSRNVMVQVEEVDRQTTLVREAQADAALVEQAYWVVRAHREGLV